VYTGKCTIFLENVREILYCACKYIIPGLVQRCAVALEANINTKTFVQYHRYAIQFNLQNLERKCWDYTLARAYHIADSSDFYNVGKKTVIKVLESPDAVVYSEFIVRIINVVAYFYV